MVPIGSMWRIGFRVIRPSMRAVGSPQRLAVQACADSCTLMANRNAIIWNAIPTRSCDIGESLILAGGRALQRLEVRGQIAEVRSGYELRATSYERIGCPQLTTHGPSLVAHGYLCNLTSAMGSTVRHGRGRRPGGRGRVSWFRSFRVYR